MRFPPTLRRKKDGSFECMLHPNARVVLKSPEQRMRFRRWPHMWRCPECYLPLIVRLKRELAKRARSFKMHRTRPARNQEK